MLVTMAVTMGTDELPGKPEVVRGYGCVSEVHIAEWPAERTPGTFPALLTAVVQLPAGPKRPAVRVYLEMGMTRGQYEIKRVMFSNDSFRRVRMSGADLRRINLDNVVSDTRQALENEQFRRGPGERLDPSFLRVGRPGRRGRPSVFYARIAQRYTELAEEPQVILRMAEELGVSRPTMARWVQYARERSFLESPGKGRQGGHLTERAQKLLDDFRHYDQGER